MNLHQRYRLFSADVPGGTTIPTDLEIACLWSALGLAITELFFAVGFGPEIAQAFLMAG
jgi:hypothetical protein